MASHHPSHASPARGSAALPPPPSSFPHGRQEFHLVSLGAAPSKLSPLPRRALAAFPAPSRAGHPRFLPGLAVLLRSLPILFFPPSGMPALPSSPRALAHSFSLLDYYSSSPCRCSHTFGCLLGDARITPSSCQEPGSGLSLLPLSLERCQVLCLCPTRRFGAWGHRECGPAGGKLGISMVKSPAGAAWSV